jgi:hypothetical protein
MEETPTKVSTLAPEADEPTESLMPTATDSPTPIPTTTSTPEPTLPSVVGPDPSYRVATFYYPWYRTPDVDQYWDHWGESRFDPPLDIASDYYPLLGLYSAVDRQVVAQHFAWLRASGVGVVISSWWGQGSTEDQAVPVLLEMGERYGVKVAFHIEPYGWRTADNLVDDVRYIYQNYGDHPAFFRTTASSRWSPDDRSKGFFFLWASRFPNLDVAAVEASYWREAIDAIHALPEGGLVIADETVSGWVDGGHFDGSYSYAVLHFDRQASYAWARSLPPGAWYVPGVNPGFSARRIGYEADTYVPREAGTAYEERWQAALSAGVEPAIVAITSFNEWHEGTQIEPAAVGVTNGLGYTYEDYDPLPPEGYLTLTRQWVDRFLGTSWPQTHRIRIRIVTTSDWTTFSLLEGADLLRPDFVSISDEANAAGMDANGFHLSQPLERGEAGGEVEMVVDVLLVNPQNNENLMFEIERGHLGWTRVELSNYSGAEPMLVETLEWAGIRPSGRNAHSFQIPFASLSNPAP